MADTAQTLIDEIAADFRRRYQESGTVAELLGKVRSGTATYGEAQEYAAEVSRLIGAAWSEHISSAVLPEGRMPVELSRQLLPSALDDNYALVADYAANVQQTLNTKAGLGLKARTSTLNPDRVDGLATLASRAEQYDEAAGTLTTAMETLLRSAVDDTLRENVEFQGKAGLRPRVIRTASAKCCAWCRALAGTYTYPNVPQDVYRRHENCRCVVEYDPGSGLRQNVHTKQWTEDAAPDKIEQRKQLGQSPEEPAGITAVKKAMTEQVQALPAAQQEALRAYTGFTATQVNSAIRSGRVSAQVQATIDQLDKALQAGMMPSTVVLHRDTTLSFLDLGLPKNPTEAQLQKLVGRTITNPMFTSTSFQALNLPGRDTEIWLTVPEGYQGCQYLRPVALPKFRGQDEVLFGRNLQYKIVDIKISGGKYVIDAEVLP